MDKYRREISIPDQKNKNIKVKTRKSGRIFKKCEFKMIENMRKIETKIQPKVQPIRRYEKGIKLFRHNNTFPNDQNILPRNKKRDDRNKANPTIEELKTFQNNI